MREQGKELTRAVNALVDNLTLLVKEQQKIIEDLLKQIADARTELKKKDPLNL